MFNKMAQRLVLPYQTRCSFEPSRVFWSYFRTPAIMFVSDLKQNKKQKHISILRTLLFCRLRARCLAYGMSTVSMKQLIYDEKMCITLI